MVQYHDDMQGSIADLCTHDNTHVLRNLPMLFVYVGHDCHGSDGTWRFVKILMGKLPVRTLYYNQYLCEK